MRRRVGRLWALIGVCCAGVVIAACGSTGGTAAGPKGSGPLKVAVNMPNPGNDWVVEAKNEIQATARSPQYASRVTLRVDVTGASATAQIQALNSEVAAGYKAIVLLPFSPTALNGAIAEACARHVTVVTWSAYTTAPCAYGVTSSDVQFGYDDALWVAQYLHGHGNIVAITGVPGATPNTDRNAGLAAVLAKYPGIHVLGSANGAWDEATSRQAFAGLYVAHPNISAIWAQAGCYGAESYLRSQHKPLLPCAGESEQGDRLLMLPKSKGGAGLPGQAVGTPVNVGAIAFQNAVALLDGKKMEHYEKVPLSRVTNQTLKLGTDPAKGANVYPPSLVPVLWFDDVYSPLSTQGLKAALNGKPDTVGPAKPCSAVPGCVMSNSVSVFRMRTGATAPY